MLICQKNSYLDPVDGEYDEEIQSFLSRQVENTIEELERLTRIKNIDNITYGLYDILYRGWTIWGVYIMI